MKTIRNVGINNVLFLTAALMAFCLIFSSGVKAYADEQNNTEEQNMTEEQNTDAETQEEFYSVELFGQTLTSEDMEIVYKNVNIGEEGLQLLRDALPHLTSCKYLLLDRCEISNESMAQLRDDFPDIKVVWRIWFPGYFYMSFLTDATVIHLACEIGDKVIYDHNSSILNYCTDMEYLDLGHGVLTNIDFCAYMPHLKYLIISYNPITDLSPLENCKELEMLELYRCYNLTDLSPVAELENLKLLNVSATGIKDFSPAYGLEKLERFYCTENNGISEEQQQEIIEALPDDCWVTFVQTVALRVGWQNDDKNVWSEWYTRMSDIWRYKTELWYFGYVD